MTYIKLLTVLTTLALLTACGGGGTAETKTDDTGEPAVSCDTNPYGADCGTEFETQRLNIVRECTDDDTGDLCDDATTFACTDNFFHELCTANEYEQLRVEFNNVCTNTKSKEVCDMEALVRTCAANPFMNTCLMDTGAIALRESMCLANIMIDDSCRGEDGIATVFCKDDPFNTATACMADTYLPARITNCITAGNANSNNNCNTLFTASASNTCLTNPFTDACTSNTDFGTYANTARTNRVSFCGMTGNAGNTLCSAGSGYANCVANPFATECGTYFQFAEESYCATNDVTDCPNVTSADWVAGFDTPPTAGDYTRPEAHGFLQGTANGLDFGNIRQATSDPRVFSLNLESLGGEAKNGVAWFLGASGATGVALPQRYYSGIFSGTNLGAPLTSADVSASVPWAGKISTLFLSSDGLDGAGLNKSDFELTVDFANSEIRAFVNRTGADHFLLKATFDGTGRFEGTMNHATFAGSVEAGAQTNVTNGVLTGLIGKQGAVGAFYGGADDTDDSQADFAGGFVAVPPSPCQVADNCVDTGDLPTYETKPNAITGSGFLTATETGLNTNTADFQFANASTRTITTPHFIGRRGGADSTNRDGFAYFATNVSGGSTLTIGYAGILPTTNLGAPLPSTTANAVWAGHFSLGAANNIAVNYYVDFGAGKFGFSNAGGNGFGNFAHANLSGTYTMNAVFGEHDDAEDFNAGQMGGTLSVLDTIITTRYDIIGLIGEEGVVGIFTRENGGVGDAGGFTATNPDYTPPE